MVNLHLAECLKVCVKPQDVLGCSVCLESCCGIHFLKRRTMDFTNRLYEPPNSGRGVCVCESLTRTDPSGSRTDAEQVQIPASWGCDVLAFVMGHEIVFRFPLSLPVHQARIRPSDESSRLDEIIWLAFGGSEH